ncbi:hypothetical protein BH23VER1_BH23VER1_24770 [soil metagenome]
MHTRPFLRIPLSCLWVAATLTVASLPAKNLGPLTYAGNGREITITGYEKSAAGAVVIPETIEGRKMTKIGQEAFMDCREITSVALPDTITHIDAKAFAGCAKLQTINVPDTILMIGAEAFGRCVSLSHINLGRITQIYDNTFDRCQSLQKVTIPDEVTSIGNDAFSGCLKLETIAIPDSVNSIGFGAFNRCRKLAAIHVSANLLTIGNVAFSNCDSLTGIDVAAGNGTYSSPGGVLFDKSETTLLQYPGGRPGDYAIPPGVTKIAQWAFGGCELLTSLSIPASYKENISLVINGQTLGAINVDPQNKTFSSVDGVLYNHEQTTLIRYPQGREGSYTVLPSTTTIAESAFSRCGGLTEVILPDGLVAIKNMALYSCESLTHIYLPSYVASIGAGAMGGCDALTSITIPESTTTVESSAFAECPSLAAAYFLGDAPDMGQGVFENSAPGFTIYFKQGQAGFSTPEWEGYPAQMLQRDDPVFNKARALANASGGGKTRTWTDHTGQHRIEAEFVGLAGTTVTLLKLDGETAKVPIDRLSAADQALARKLAQER